MLFDYSEKDFIKRVRMILESDNNIKLRPLALSDKLVLATLVNNKKIWDNLRDYIPHPYDESDAKFFINLTQKECPRQNFGIAYNDELCGVIGLIPQKDVHKKSAEIGYWIGEPYWGKGIATKAVALIINYGFEKLDLIRIYSGVFGFNKASMKVLEKNNYQKEGVFKNAIVKNGEIHDEHRYCILRS